MTPPEGNPFLKIRIDPAILEALEKKAGASPRGGTGGVSEYVRNLIYRDLEMPLPTTLPSETQRSRFWNCAKCGQKVRSMFASCPRCFAKHPAAVQDPSGGWYVPKEAL